MLPNTVDIQLTRNPFESGRVHSYAFEGETIEHMIVSRGLRLDAAHGILVSVGGELVPERMFSRVKPKAGVSVVIKVIPRGGQKGKAILQIVIGVLAVAASIASFGATTPLTGPQAFAALSTGIAGLAGIAGGITSLLAPPPAVPFDGNIPQSADSAALTGTRNSARLYGPIRTVLGQYRVYPDLLGKPFEERVGNDSILRLLMCFGYGPLSIDRTTIKIGETPINELIPESKYVVHEGWTDDPDLSIFRDEVDMNVSFRPELKRLDEEGASLEPSSGIMTTGTDPKEISIDIAFPGGLIAFDTEGKPLDVTVRFEVEEREVGDVSWTNISDPTEGVNSSTGFKKISAGVFDLKLSQRGSITRGLRWPVPVGSDELKAHEVQITRVSTSSPEWTDDWSGEEVERANNALVSDAIVTVIRTIRPHIASKIKNLAKIELEINASETGLSNVIDNLSAVCTSIVPEFDVPSQSWGPTAAASDALGVSMHKTRNAAWLFAHMLRGPGNSRPVDDSRIDAAGLAVWAGNLDGVGSFEGAAIGGYPNNDITLSGIKRHTDAVVESSTTTRKLLSDIAATGRASLNIVDGKYSIVADGPQDQIIQHFTPRNSSGFSGSKVFRKEPHAVRVHFINPEPNEGVSSYQKDERIVYNDGYSESGEPAVSLAFRGSATPTSIIEGNTAGTASAWSTSGHCTLTGHQGYAARLTVTSWDPHFQSGHVGVTNNYLGIDTTGDKPPIYVRMKMRRIYKGSDDTWNGQMFFAADTDSFSAGGNHTTTEPDWTKGWVTLVWDMTTPANGTWLGQTINRIRFDLVYAPQTIVDGDHSIFDIESVIVDDGTQAATEFAELSLWGVADAHQAYRDGRYHLASTKLRPEIFSITTDVEHLVCNRGDLVKVSHDVIGVGYGAARLKSVTILDETTNAHVSALAGVQEIQITEGDRVHFPADSTVSIALNDGEVFNTAIVFGYTSLSPTYDVIHLADGLPSTGTNGTTSIEAGAAITNTSSFAQARMDEEFFYESGKSYAIRIRGFTSGNVPAEAVINLENLSGTSSYIVHPPPGGYDVNASGAVKPAVGDLVMFGERSTESIDCIVKSITPSNDLTATLELVEYNKAVYETELDIPAHNSNITLEGSPNILRPLAPVIVGELISDETVAEYSASGTPNIRIVMNVSTPQTTSNPSSSEIGNIGSYAPTTHFHAQFRKKSGEDAVTDWINVPRVEAFGDTEVSIRPVEQDSIYDVRVRSISDSKASASNWLYRSNHTVIGLSTPPPAPTSLSVWGTAIRWEYGAKPSDFAGFIVKHQGGDDATWATGIPITTNLITDNWIQINGRIQYGTTTIMVRAVDVAGNESATLSAVKLIRTPEQLDDIKTETWTGTWGSAHSRINCTIDPADNYLIADVASSFAYWTAGVAPFWANAPSAPGKFGQDTGDTGLFLNDGDADKFPIGTVLEIPLNDGTLFNPTVTDVDEFGASSGYDLLTLDTGFPETHGGLAPTYELSYQPSDGLITTHEPFWRGVDIYEEMSFLGEVETEHDFADLTGANWPVDADFPCREYVSQLDTQGTDYKIEYRPFQSETGGTYTYFPNVDWAPWPGERTLDEPEFPFRVAGSDVERLLIRFTIAGGRTQGKLKAAEFKVEGIKKTHREILTVATTGTLVDLTGKGFRKITSVSITPANTGSTITQAGVRGQAYDLIAKQQPGGAGTTYELSGPQVVLSSQGDASVTIEGY